MKKAKVQLIFTILIFAFFIYTAIEALSFKKLASYFPLYISLAAALLILIEIVRQVIHLSKAGEELFHPNVSGAIKYMFVLSAYILLIYLIGLVPASIIYVFCFLYFIARMKLLQSVIAVVVLTTIIITFGNVMKLFWPGSLITIF